MKKYKLKYQYIPLLIAIFVLLPLLALSFFYNKSLKPQEVKEDDYVNEEIIDRSLPVINTKKTIINPFIDPKVKEEKYYYDYKADEENQINSIIARDNTYTQNTGIDYVSDNTFDVVAILEGTVSSIKEEDSLGKTVEIKHDNGLISIYQSLSEISVKKGEIVTQGQVIGKSGENEVDKELGNHLHFEIYNNGKSVNPNNYLNKEVTEKEEN